MKSAWQFCSRRCLQFVSVIEESLAEWNNDNVPRLAAALAFYTLLSLSPLLVIGIALAGFVFGRPAATGELAQELQTLLGPEAALAIEDVIRNAYQPGAGAIATVLSVATLIIGSTGAAVELRDSLNTIWHVPVASKRTRLGSIISLVRERFYSFALVLACGLLLLVSFALSAFIAAVGSFLNSVVSVPEARLHLTTYAFSFLLFWLLFAAIYKTVPNIYLEWRDVIIGASITSLLLNAGKLLISMYLGKASFHSTYGAAGSAVITLVWVYYSAQLFFLGAEFTKVYARKFGSHINDVTPATPAAPNEAPKR